MQSSKLMLALVVCGVVLTVETAEAGRVIGIDSARLSGGGIVVTGVYPGLPAQQVGLGRGDVLLSVNGTRIQSPEHLVELLQSAGSVAHFVARSGRSGRLHFLTIRVIDPDQEIERLRAQARVLQGQLRGDVEGWRRARDARIFFDTQTSIGILNAGANLYR